MSPEAGLFGQLAGESHAAPKASLGEGLAMVAYGLGPAEASLSA